MTAPKTVQTRHDRRLAEIAARRDTRRQPGQPRRRLSLGLLSVIGIVGGLAVVALAVALGTRPAATGTDPLAVEIAHAPAGVVSEGFVLGRADAPVTIDLFEDFQCPACEEWGRTVFARLAANELSAGTVKIVFHDMAFVGTESRDAGRAAYAASQQGRFWDMWTTLYANQGRENSGAFSRERLLAMARQLGFNMTRFEADMDSTAAGATIDASRAAANVAGVSSTPTLIIDGVSYVGVRPYPEIAQAIAAAAAP